MYREALQAPDVVTRQLDAYPQQMHELAQRCRATSDAMVATIARGSSDHAAQFVGYLLMSRLGLWVSSLPMSLVTLFHAPLRADHVMTLAFSQSGRSPDLVIPTQYLREHGALTIALVNELDSPLQHAAEYFIPLHAGTEHSVAATKSYLAQLVAGASLVARWQDDPALWGALQRLPELLQANASVDWSAAISDLVDVDQLMVLGRGFGYPVAMEAALKLKETCGIQAHAYSSAEVQHGPMSLIGQGYPVILLALPGPTLDGVLALAARLRDRGAKVLLIGPQELPGVNLPYVGSLSHELDPILAIFNFYRLVEALARAKGLNPDQPRFLSKVTCTQ